jgi:hypothetical protein
VNHTHHDRPDSRVTLKKTKPAKPTIIQMRSSTSVRSTNVSAIVVAVSVGCVLRDRGFIALGLLTIRTCDAHQKLIFRKRHRMHAFRA